MNSPVKPPVLEKNGIFKSYIIGVPVGLIAVLLFISLPTMLTGEGLLTIALMYIYGHAIIGLLLSFFIVLGFAGHFAAKKIKKGSSLLAVSFFYSFAINSVIWPVFILVTVVDHYKENIEYFYFYLPVIFYVISTFLSTFTIGLIICNAIKPEKAELPPNKYYI